MSLRSAIIRKASSVVKLGLLMAIFARMINLAYTIYTIPAYWLRVHVLFGGQQMLHHVRKVIDLADHDHIAGAAVFFLNPIRVIVLFQFRIEAIFWNAARFIFRWKFISKPIAKRDHSVTWLIVCPLKLKYISVKCMMTFAGLMNIEQWPALCSHSISILRANPITNGCPHFDT